MKHGNNMKKQDETVAHLAWTRNVHTKECGSTDAAMEYTVARPEGGKWLLYSKAKLVKPYDYVASDFSVSVQDMLRNGSGSDKEEQGLKPAHSSGPNTSQYTFANVGAQACGTSMDSRKASEGTNHHGWQLALMTGFMWLSNDAGEFLYRMGERLQTSPARGPSQLVDDPIGMMEQVLVDLKLTYAGKDISGTLKHLAILLYYSVQMATHMQVL